MLSARLSRILKYSIIGGATIGTAVSLQANQYQLDSIGVVRLGRAAVTVFKCGLIYKTELYAEKLDKQSEEYKELKSVCHKKCAEKLLELCCKNKGVYIKVGQHIAALEYLLPTEYVQTMKVLHSHAPTNAIEEIYKVIKEDLKQDVNEVFATIDPEPLGVASLAQVHKATLHDGSVVAVKVQHPYVQGNSRVDMKTMEYLVSIMSFIFPEFKFKWLVDETKKNIPQELNFEQEGHNAEKIAKMFSDVQWLQIPKIRWDLTTKRVLTMDFLEGGQVNDLKYIQENKINPYEISDKLGQLYSKMIFIHGFVHSDPHPGNILVKKSPKGDCDIVLLDHGLYAELKDDFRVEYSNLWLSILDRDKIAMKEHCKNLGIEGNVYGLFACMVTGRPWDSIMTGINKKVPTKSEKDFLQSQLKNILPQVSGVLENVNRQMLLVLKTNDLIRGIEHTLKTSQRMGAFKVMTQCCIRSVYNQRICESPRRIDRFRIVIAQYWQLFKVNLYYTYLKFAQISGSFTFR